MSVIAVGRRITHEPRHSCKFQGPQQEKGAGLSDNVDDMIWYDIQVLCRFRAPLLLTRWAATSRLSRWVWLLCVCPGGDQALSVPVLASTSPVELTLAHTYLWHNRTYVCIYSPKWTAARSLPVWVVSASLKNSWVCEQAGKPFNPQILLEEDWMFIVFALLSHPLFFLLFSQPDISQRQKLIASWLPLLQKQAFS